MDRDYVINEYSKNNFMDFLTYDKTGAILELFNEEGINILKNSRRREERISYILTYSPYKNELLKNIAFLDMFLDTHISSYYAVLSNLESKTYDVIINRTIELNKSPEFITELFDYLNLEYKLSKLDNYKFSKEIIYNILNNSSNPEIIQKIISNYDIDLAERDLDLKRLFYKAKESSLKAQAKRNSENINVEYIHIPTTMITKEVAEKIWRNYNIFEARTIINDAAYCTDITHLNNYIKYKEEEMIQSYNSTTLLSPFQELYTSFKNYKLEEENLKQGIVQDESNFIKYRQQYIGILKNVDNDLAYKFQEIYHEFGLEGAEEYLRKSSENSLSNYMIDYHFEENYHNIMIDIRELLNFYYNGEIVIPRERAELYDKISNIDWLLPEEKIELHTTLKNYNMIELFYDDMAMARQIVSEAIKEYSLSSQTLKQYKDKELSEKYGVDVYNMNGEPFFGIVKSGRGVKDKLPTGHSYSLVGNGCIAVFSPEDTYLYDSNDMNPEQLVHAFPFDSFTYYHPFEEVVDGTRRVNTLAMPDEILNASKGYTELLILEQGEIKTDIDKSIPELKRIARYCIDQISEEDIIKAKNEGMGIILVNSRKYENKNEAYFGNFHDIDHWSYNYFDGSYEKEKFEAKRY